MLNHTYYSYNTPFGPITIGCSDEIVESVCFGKIALDGAFEPTVTSNDCATQLLEYFAGKRRVFDIELDIKGSDFQKDVWRALDLIPYAHTATSKDIAEALGRPQSYRLVGSAIKDNPLAVIIPAHRIIPANGYVDKHDRSAQIKAALRDMEATHARI